MKKIFITVMACVALSACSDSKPTEETESKNEETEISSKGHWSNSDIKKAEKAMKEIDADLDYLGNQKQVFIDCYLDKIMNNYDSFAEADTDIDGCAAIGAECTESLDLSDTGSTSTAGNWSADDIAIAKKEIEAIDGSLDGLGDLKEPFKDCYLESVMMNYNSFAEANLDEDGCAQLAEECMSGLLAQ